MLPRFYEAHFASEASFNKSEEGRFKRKNTLPHFAERIMALREDLPQIEKGDYGAVTCSNDPVRTSYRTRCW